MKTRLKILLVGLSAFAFATSAAAHQPTHPGGYGGGLSGGVSVWSGGPYGPGYAGNLNYGRGYATVPVYYPQPVYYQGRRHRHAKHYSRGYDRGYSKGYKRGHRNKHQRRRGKDRHH